MLTRDTAIVRFALNFDSIGKVGETASKFVLKYVIEFVYVSRENFTFSLYM